MGLPSLQALGWGGGALLLLNIFQGGGGLRTTLGGVGLRGLGGCSLLCFTSAFLFDFSTMGLTKCTFEVAGMPCNAAQCCGVLWSRKV